MTEAIEGRRPATHEDIRDLRAELRAIGRRLDAIEERLPAKRRQAASGGSSRSKATRSGTSRSARGRAGKGKSSS